MVGHESGVVYHDAEEIDRKKNDWILSLEFEMSSSDG